MRFTQYLAPYYAEIQNLTRGDRGVREALLADRNRQAQYNLLVALLKKKANEKKEENDSFFARLNYNAFVEFRELLTQFNTLKEQISHLFEDDLKRANAQSAMNAMVRDSSQPQKLADLSEHELEIRKLLIKGNQLKEELYNIMRQYTALQMSLNNWRAEEWRSKVQAAAVETAKDVIKDVVFGMEQSEDYLMLRAGLNGLESHQAINNEIAQRFEVMRLDLQASLSQRATPDDLIQHVTPLRNAFLQEANGLTNAAVKKTAIEKIIEPIYRLNEDINIAGHARAMYQHIKDLCHKFNLSMSYKDVLNRFNPVRLAVDYTNNAKCRDILDIYHQKIKTAYEKNVDDHALLAELAHKGEAAKVNLEQLMQALHALVPHSSKSATQPKNANRP